MTTNQAIPEQIPKMQNVTSATIKATYWKLLSVSSQMISNLVILTVLSRLLTPFQFGLVAAAQIMIGFLALFSDIGVSSALIQKKEITEQHINTGFVTSICLGLIICLLLWFTAPFFSQLLNLSTTIKLIRILSLAFPIISLGTISEALLIRKLDFRRLFFADLASTIITYSIISILMALLGFGEWSLVGGTIASSAARTTYLLLVKDTHFKFKFKSEEFHELFSFGGRYSVLRIVNYFSQKGDNLVVSKFMGASALGLYDRAFSLMSYPGLLLGNVLDGTMFPSMSIFQEKTEVLKSMYYRSLSLVNIILMPLSIFLVVTTPEIVNILLGEKWSAINTPLQVLFLSIPLRGATRMCDSLARAKGALTQNTAIKMTYALLIIIGSYIGKEFGLVGVAIGVDSAVIIHYSLMTLLGEKLISGSLSRVTTTFKEGLRYSIPFLIASLGSILFLRYYIHNYLLILLIEICLNVIAFLLITYSFSKFVGDDLKWLVSNIVNSIPNIRVKNRIIYVTNLLFLHSQ